MKHIRPWELFEKLSGDREVFYCIPSHRGKESETISSLETMLLVAVARIVEAESIFEFGTGLGYNALHLAMNTDAAIETVDRVRKRFVFEGTPSEGQIAILTKDIFDVSPNPSDMVFCDINYTLETVARCSALAFACEPMVIAWHDYGEPGLEHVKLFLDALSELVHVEDSRLVFWFKEPLL